MNKVDAGKKAADGETLRRRGLIPRLGQWLLRTQESSIIIILVLYVTMVACVNPIFLSDGDKAKSITEWQNTLNTHPEINVAGEAARLAHWF